MPPDEPVFPKSSITDYVLFSALDNLKLLPPYIGSSVLIEDLLIIGDYWEDEGEDAKAAEVRRIYNLPVETRFEFLIAKAVSPYYSLPNIYHRPTIVDSRLIIDPRTI